MLVCVRIYCSFLSKRKAISLSLDAEFAFGFAKMQASVTKRTYNKKIYKGLCIRPVVRTDLSSQL